MTDPTTLREALLSLLTTDLKGGEPYGHIISDLEPDEIADYLAPKLEVARLKEHVRGQSARRFEEDDEQLPFASPLPKKLDPNNSQPFIAALLEDRK